MMTKEEFDALPVGSWANDIDFMHEYYGHDKAVQALDPAKLKTLMKFRRDFIIEEGVTELDKAIQEEDPEEIVDALIDLCVVAIGFLNLFGVDAQKAWDEVLRANMSKTSGVNPTRPNELGLPDLIKPADFQKPDHTGNHGFLAKAFEA